MEMVELLPYDKFFINCIFNSRMTMLTSINKTYADIAILNCYKYKILGKVFDVELSKDIDFNYFILEPLNEILNETVNKNINFKEITFNKGSEFKKDLIDLLSKNNMFLPVDLYSYIPNSYCWERRHWDHQTLVKSYDAISDEFITIDDDYDGYKLHRVPSERFIKSINNSRLDLGCVLEYNKQIENYKLEMINITDNSNCLIKMLEKAIIYTEHLEDKLNYTINTFERYSGCTNQIVNRQVANLLLATRIYDLGFINKKIFIDVKNNFTNLIDGWTLVKNLFLKASKDLKNKSVIDKIKNYIFKLIIIEIETWNKIC